MSEPNPRGPAPVEETDEKTPQENGQGRGQEQQEEAGSQGQGSTTKETRWEVGIFARRVTTQSSSPPGGGTGPDY